MARRAKDSFGEIGLKLAFLGGAVVMLIGGIGALASLVRAILVLAGALGAGALVIWGMVAARLAVQKQTGIILVLASLIMTWWWSGNREPLPWIPEPATVSAVHRANTATATLMIGTVPSLRTATVPGPRAASLSVGNKITVWRDPLWTGFSFEPRITDQGNRPGLLVSALGLGALGVCLLVIGKEWVVPCSSEPAKPRGHSRGSEPVRTPSISQQLRAIDWFQFEAVSARNMEHDGWLVRRNGGAKPDGGADLVALKEGQKAVVQCKHWHRFHVRPNIIRELIGTKSSTQFNASLAVLFTLSSCTDEALACALHNNVTVYDAAAIETMIERIGVERFPELLAPEDKTCPKCGAPMVLRKNAPTPFWGCSTYPRCRGKIERV